MKFTTTPNDIRECACGCGQLAPTLTKNNSRLGHIKGQQLKFVSGHNSKANSSLDLLMLRVSVSSDNQCWNWSGPVNRKGYGHVQVRGVTYNAHRAFYIESGYEIPDGFHLDHLCRNKICVNPSRMEPVTLQENVRRQHQARQMIADGEWIGSTAKVEDSK
jgi:hypothetical protein